MRVAFDEEHGYLLLMTRSLMTRWLTREWRQNALG
jgi:hypothetical protein